MSLIDSSLVTHSQLTRDVGVVMSSAMMSRRQIWLTQTSLPEDIRKELTNIPIVPAGVFHPDSQGMLDKAEQSCRTRDCVRHTFSRTMAPRYGSRGLQHSNHPPGARQEPWWQHAGFPASGGTQSPSCRQQQFQPHPPGKEVSHRRCPPQGYGTTGRGPIGVEGWLLQFPPSFAWTAGKKVFWTPGCWLQCPQGKGSSFGGDPPFLRGP